LLDSCTAELPLPQVAARLGIGNDGARAGIVACGGTIRPHGRQPVRKQPPEAPADS